MGQSTQQTETQEGHGSQRQRETDDAYFARERERRDPETAELDDMENTDDLDDDTLDPDAARNLGGGEGDFRSMQDTGDDDTRQDL